MARNYVVGLFKYGGLVELITRGGGGGGKKKWKVEWPCRWWAAKGHSAKIHFIMVEAQVAMYVDYVLNRSELNVQVVG